MREVPESPQPCFNLFIQITNMLPEKEEVFNCVERKNIMATLQMEEEKRCSEEGRNWILRGEEDCVHYWIGTGERKDGREKFVCCRCGAAMTEPLALEPVREALKPVPRGCSVCGVCGGIFHWTRTFRNPLEGSSRICLDCLSEWKEPRRLRGAGSSF